MRYSVAIRYLLIFCVFAGIALGLLGCGLGESSEKLDLTKRVSDKTASVALTNDGADDPEVFNFGFDLRGSPHEDARQYLPFLDYLEQATSYRFRLRFTPNDGEIIDDLGSNVVQFAAIGAESYIRARHQYHVIPLVRGLNQYNKAEYQSVIVVAPGSPVEQLQDLVGKRFAFGSLSSTRGHLIPRIVLQEHGISLQDFKLYDHTGSHTNCAKAVISGEFDACGMQDIMGRQLAAEGLLRIVHESNYFPSSGIVTNSKVPEEVRDRVKQALLDFKPLSIHAKRLYRWQLTEMSNGFVEADDEDYHALHEWNHKFGLIRHAEASAEQ